MAARIPLVINGGQIEQLQSEDSLSLKNATAAFSYSIATTISSDMTVSVDTIAFNTVTVSPNATLTILSNATFTILGLGIYQ